MCVHACVCLCVFVCVYEMFFGEDYDLKLTAFPSLDPTVIATLLCTFQLTYYFSLTGSQHLLRSKWRTVCLQRGTGGKRGGVIVL